MANEKSKRGRLIAGMGAMAGLFSGAFLMYLTPLVDRVFKPAPPVANFEARPDGLSVHFHNVSSGQGLSGWWDFGDGSALVPFMQGEDVSHAYAKPGGYMAKLSLRSVLGETNERTVTLNLESSEGESPRILHLDAVPIATDQAPATFKIASELKNAQLAVWDLDEDRPLEVAPASPGKQERLVTFEKPGGYVIKLAAFNGQQHEQKAVTINVKPAPQGCLTVALHVTDQATLVERVDRPFNFGANFPPDHKGDSYPVRPTVSAPGGWTIADVLVGSKVSMRGQSALALDAAALKAGPVRNLQLKRDADGKSVKLSGELTRSSKKDTPAMMLPVVLREERRKPVTRLSLPVMSCLTLPGSARLALPPLPQGWESPKRQVRLELRDGGKVVWQGQSLPGGVPVQIRQQRYTLTAVQNGDSVQVHLGALNAR